MSATAVYETRLAGLRTRGKVRDIYDLGDRLMIVASDRISAFDVVMNEPVPGKGALLTSMSRFWMESLPACAPHHLEYVVDEQRCPAQYVDHAAALLGRAMIVQKARVIPIECVVRGYIVGGGWKEYQSGGRISGVALPAGLCLADRLPNPIFTPSTKAASGHDEPISFEGARAHLAAEFARDGSDLDAAELRISAAARLDWPREPAARADCIMRHLRDRSLAIYTQAAAHAASRGVIIADTKFEFGLLRIGNAIEVLLIDEVLTPDSSRFWPAESWQPGRNPPSFDKQFLRDYLETLRWNKAPPPPPIPPDIIEQTRQRYAEAHRKLTTRTGD